MINKEYSKLTSDISMSAALEFIHAATLLHDDVIDKGKLQEEAKEALMIFGIINLVSC